MQANVLLAHTAPIRRERTPAADGFISEELRDTVEIALEGFGQVLPRLGLSSFKRPKVLVPHEPLAEIARETNEGFASGRLETQAEVKPFFEGCPYFPRSGI